VLLSVGRRACFGAKKNLCRGRTLIRVFENVVLVAAPRDIGSKQK
jgi:hypothetical protein